MHDNSRHRNWMHGYWIQRIRSDGPQIVINCPRCGVDGVKGFSYVKIESGLLLVIPYFMQRTFLRCPACGKVSISKVLPERLAQMDPNEISHLIRPPGTTLPTALAVLAWLVWPVPMLGVIVAASAVQL